MQDQYSTRADMVVDEMKQVIHIHNPRTAGNAMRSWVRRRQFGYQELYQINERFKQRDWKSRFNPSVAWTYLGHTTPGELIENEVITQEWFEGCFRFVFVRNTWSRLVSFYEFLRGSSQRMKRPEWKHLADFGAFVQHVISGKDNLPRFRYRQIPWLQWGVDFVGRFESLEIDWKRLCGEVGVECSPLRRRGIRISKTPRDYRQYYTDELRGMVADYYADEIVKFGFEF